MLCVYIYIYHTCDTRHPPSNTLGRLGLWDVIFWGKVSSTLEDHGTIALTNARGGNHWQGASGSVPWNSTAIGYSCSGVAVCKLQPFWSLQRCPSWRWIQTMTGSFSEDWNLGISPSTPGCCDNNFSCSQSCSCHFHNLSCAAFGDPCTAGWFPKSHSRNTSGRRS